MVNKNHIHEKLQDAYVAEAAAMGSWDKIGYKMNNGDTFDYTPQGLSGSATTLVEALGDGVEGWRATSKVKLNDCPNASYWNITVMAATNYAQGMVSYTTAVEGGDKDQECKDLTPSSKLDS